MLNSKISTLINSFLSSKISSGPALQVDIAESTAKKIISSQKELSHLLFQQAQNTIFQILLVHWREFLVEESELESGVLGEKGFEERRRIFMEIGGGDGEDLTPRTHVGSKSLETADSISSSTDTKIKNENITTIKFCYSEYFINKSLTIM